MLILSILSMTWISILFHGSILFIFNWRSSIYNAVLFKYISHLYLDHISILFYYKLYLQHSTFSIVLYYHLIQCHISILTHYINSYMWQYLLFICFKLISSQSICMYLIIHVVISIFSCCNIYLYSSCISQ